MLSEIRKYRLNCFMLCNPSWPHNCPCSSKICKHSLVKKAINLLLRKAQETPRVPSLNAPMLIKTVMQIWKQLKIRLCLSITVIKQSLFLGIIIKSSNLCIYKKTEICALKVEILKNYGSFEDAIPYLMSGRYF